MEMLFSLEEGKFWRRTVVEEQTYLKHRTVCLKLVTMVNFMHFLPHLKKEGAGGRGSNLIKGSTRCRFQQDTNNIMKEL